MARDERDVRAEVGEARGALSGGRRADDPSGAEMPRHLHRHQADATGRAMDQHRFAAHQLAVADERVVRRLQRHRKDAAIGEVEPARKPIDATPVGDGVLGIAAAARGDDGIADGDASGAGRRTDGRDRARPLDADGGAETPAATMLSPRRHLEIGAVERRRVHAHQDFRGLRHRLRDIRHFDAASADDDGFHPVVPALE